MAESKRKREPSGLDLSDFLPAEDPIGQAPEMSMQNDKIAAVRSAAETGFTSRKAGGSQIDGRTLRRTGRTVQMNIKVTEETKERFWRIASQTDERAAGAVLERLLDHYDKTVARQSG